MSALWILALSVSVVLAGDYCSKVGEVRYIDAYNEYICTRTGELRGVDLLTECIQSLGHISEDRTPNATSHYTKSEFCQPGTTARSSRASYTCYCQKSNEWDCHKGKNDDKKPVPIELGGRSLDAAKARTCDKDVIIPKMFTDFCDVYGQYITYDDCLIRRNQTAHSHTLAEELGPVMCLPGSYVIYMRCMRCPCVNGAPQTCTEMVDCPWISSS